MNSLFISWLSIISQQHSQLHSSSDWKSDLLSLKKSDIFWPAFFLPTFFRWLLHTFLPRFPYFFCHVRKKKIFFTTFLPTANTINHVLPARVPVLHMFRFPSSSEIFIVLPLSVCWNYKLSHHQFCHPYLLPANSSILETPQIHLVYRLSHHQCLHQLQSIAVQIRQLMLTTVHTAILCILQKQHNWHQLKNRAYTTAVQSAITSPFYFMLPWFLRDVVLQMNFQPANSL